MNLALLKKTDYRVLSVCSNSIKNKYLDKIMPVITHSNDYGLLYLSLITFSVIFKLRTHEAIKVLEALAIGLFLGEGLIKHIVRRSRPEDHVLKKSPLTYSFPSGHTTSAFAALGVLWFMNSNLKYIFLIIALLISFSRLYLQVHYPSDVLAGMLLGIACGKFIVILSGNMDLFPDIVHAIAKLSRIT